MGMEAGSFIYRNPLAKASLGTEFRLVHKMRTERLTPTKPSQLVLRKEICSTGRAGRERKRARSSREIRAGVDW